MKERENKEGFWARSSRLIRSWLFPESPVGNLQAILTGTVSRDNKQIKLYRTYSRAHALWGLVPVSHSYFKPFHSFQCPHINQKKLKADKRFINRPISPPWRQLTTIAALLPDNLIFSALPSL